MSTIADKLQDLIDAKADMKSAIEEKEVTVTGGLTSYAAAISQINTSSKLYVIDGMKFQYSLWDKMPNMLDFSRVTNANSMFYNCYNMTETIVIDVDNFTDITSMFGECEKLSKCYFKGDPSKITSAYYVFDDHQYAAVSVTVYYDVKYEDQWMRVRQLIYESPNSTSNKTVYFKAYDYELNEVV